MQGAAALPVGDALRAWARPQPGHALASRLQAVVRRGQKSGRQCWQEAADAAGHRPGAPCNLAALGVAVERIEQSAVCRSGKRTIIA